MYITILQFSELPKQIQEKILVNRPDLRLRLDTINDSFHILENGNVYYAIDLKCNTNSKLKILPCYTYPKSSFEFADFFSTTQNILEYPDIPSTIFIDPDNIAYKLFLAKFNDIYSNFGAEVGRWLIMYRYLKPAALQNKYQITRSVAKRILDYLTELGFIKKNRDGWNVTKETEKTIYDKITEFDQAKENMWVKGEEELKTEKNIENISDLSEEEFLQKELATTSVISSKPTKKQKIKKK